MIIQSKDEGPAFGRFTLAALHKQFSTIGQPIVVSA
jgi:hypothetical protein